VTFSTLRALLAPFLIAPFALMLAGCGGVPTQQTQAPPTETRQEAAPPETAQVREPASSEPRETSAESSGRSRHRHRNRKHGRGGNAEAPADPQLTNVTGNFDFYLLSLSWSPGFCATPAGRNDPGQCAPGRKFAFVLHGLWPQYEQKGWPEDCGTEPADPALVQKMLGIMPAEKLVEHEWTKHGTCSGLSQKDYFEEADEAFHSIKIPAQYVNLSQELTVDPAEVRTQFAAANPKVGEPEFVVECSGNRYLSEVHACLTKDLAGRACNREEQAHQCRSNAVVMRPVR
jgi:ribonuclease T2